MVVVSADPRQAVTPESFARHGGSVAGVATGLAGFAQVSRDDERQGHHDEIAATVVACE
jgi:hypothetical protein